MTENKVRHIVALGMWMALFGYYLAWHFSWMSFLFFGITLLYLFCTIVVPKKSDDNFVVWSLGNMLGASCAMLLSFHVLNQIVPMFSVGLKTGFWAAISSFFSRLFSLLSLSGFKFAIRGFGSYIMLIAAVVCFFSSKSQSHPNLVILLKYLWTYFLVAVLINTNYKSIELLLLLFAITLVFVACDIMSYQHNGRRNKAGKRWYNILSVLFVLAVAIKPASLSAFTDLEYLEHFFVSCGFKWYTALFIFVVLLVGEFFMICYSNVDNDKNESDVIVGWNAISMLIAMFFISRFYVGYWWVLVVLYVIGLGIAIRAFNPVATAGNETKRILTYWLMPLLSVVVIITVIAGSYGKLLITWTIIGGVLLISNQYRRRTSGDPWWKEARFYTVVLGVIVVCAAVGLWSSNRFTFGYLLLGGMFLVSTAFVWTLSVNSDFMPQKHRILPIITAACLAVLCISLCCKSGGKIVISKQDYGKVAVEVSSRRDRKIVSTEYYWLDDYLYEDNEQGGFPKERRIENKYIPDRDGRLRVVVTDNYGSQVERICWVHANKYDK